MVKEILSELKGEILLWASVIMQFWLRKMVE